MKTGKMIRWTFVLGSLCVSLWQAPMILQKLQSATAATPGAGFPDLSKLTGQGGLPALPGLPTVPANASMNGQASAQNLAALQAALAGKAPEVNTAAPSVEKPREVVIYSPDGKELSAEERARLQREAERLRPRVKQEPK